MSALSPLEKPAQAQVLLGFDYDGTLAVDGVVPEVSPHFFECVKYIREKHQAIWGICTGRSMFQLVEGFNEGQFPFLPDFVIAREREIYFPGNFGRWTADKQWNDTSEKLHGKLFKKSKRTLKKIQTYVEKETQGQWICQPGDPAGFISHDEAEMDRVVAFVEELKKPEELTHERNGIYMRFSHANYNKGTCLAELGRRLDILPSHTFAAGDNYNDLTMLTHEVAENLACPANSKEEIKAHVRSLGGHVGTKAGSEGIIQCLAKYFA